MMHSCKKLVIAFLASCAKRKLKHWHPLVIAITGSVGKTTAKEVIATVLSERYHVKKTEGNYNTEIGLPLTILNVKTPGDVWGWPFVLIRSFLSSFQQDQHDCFVVEMGADKPGDIAYLTTLIHPQIGIVTNVEKVHLAEGQFKDLQDIQKEKSMMIRCLSAEELAILNNDNRYTREMAKMTKAHTLFYGKEKTSHVHLVQWQSTMQGLSFSVQYHDGEYEFSSPVIGEFFLYAFLPAITVGLYLHIPIEQLQQSIANFSLPKGRFNLIAGINHSMLIDSTYNASPYAVQEAVHAFSQMPARRKILVLGSMNELGQQSAEEHQKLGSYVASFCDILLTVGAEAAHISSSAARKVPTLKIHHCGNYHEAVDFLHPLLQKGDLVLLKGSQNNVFLEEMVKALMQDPTKAKDLLVRQGPEWKRKKNL
jgi:UDP-N-acetylmuramoyl-tripeptide--D-alanyl-D-alanine ligase